MIRPTLSRPNHALRFSRKSFHPAFCHINSPVSTHIKLNDDRRLHGTPFAVERGDYVPLQVKLDSTDGMTHQYGADGGRTSGGTRRSVAQESEPEGEESASDYSSEGVSTMRWQLMGSALLVG